MNITEENYEDFINDMKALYDKCLTEPYYYPEYLDEDIRSTMEKWEEMSNGRKD